MSEPRGCSSRAVLAAVALLSGAFILPAPAGAEPSAEYIPHGPISVNGNAALAALATAENWPGKGTPAEPYVLEGYEFRTTGTAVSITSIGVSLVVRNNRFIDAGGHGFHSSNLFSTAHVRVEGNTFEGVRGTSILTTGVGRVEILGNSITKSRFAAITAYNFGGEATISGNVLTRAGEGAGSSAYGIGAFSGKAQVTDNVVEMVAGTGILTNSFYGPNLIARNEVRGWSETGIFAGYTRNPDRIEANDLRDGSGPAIRIGDVTDPGGRVVVDGNTITGGNLGVKLERVKGVTVSGNTFDGTATAIELDTVTGSTVRGNRLFGDLALDLKLAKGNLIYDNLFRSKTQLRMALSDGNLWNASKTAGTNVLGGKFLGGNAWPDYTGVDADLDGLGEIPHGLVPYGTLPRNTDVEDAYASLLPYGPYDQRPLVALPASAGVLQKLPLPALPAPPAP